MNLQILHICQPTTEGTAAVVESLSRAAIGASYTVVVACPSQGGLAQQIVKMGGRHVEMQLTRQPAWRDMRHLTEIRRLCKSADIVHLHSSMAGFLGRIALIGAPGRPKVIFTPHGWSWYSSRRLGWFYRVLEVLLSSSADVIVAVGDREFNDGRAALGGRRLVLIRNGVDPELFSPDLTCTRQGRTIVCVGRLSFQKGQDRLIRALAFLKDPTVRLVLVGEGPMRSELEHLANGLHLSDRVDFEGFASPLSFYQRATIVAFPSRWEGLSLAMLEAMSTAAPVVATSAMDVVALTGCAAIVPAAEDVPQALASTIEQMLESSEWRASLGAAARRTVLSKYTVARTCKAYLDLYRALSERRSSQ